MATIKLNVIIHVLWRRNRPSVTVRAVTLYLWHQLSMTLIISHWPLPLHRINNNID